MLTAPDGSTRRFFADLDMIIQDGGAHKFVFGCKGDGGHRLCMLCSNLVSANGALADHDATNTLVCSITHEEDLSFATDADIVASVDRLKAYRLTDSVHDFDLSGRTIMKLLQTKPTIRRYMVHPVQLKTHRLRLVGMSAITK